MDRTQLQELDAPCTKLNKHSAQLMNSFPAKLLYNPKDIGTCIKSPSDLILHHEERTLKRVSAILPYFYKIVASTLMHAANIHHTTTVPCGRIILTPLPKHLKDPQIE